MLLYIILPYKLLAEKARFQDFKSIPLFSSAIGREELMLSPQLKREQYSLARICQRFQAGLMHTLTKLACLQEPYVGAMFIYGNWARNLSFFLHHTFHTSCYLLVKHDCCFILKLCS